VDRRLSKTKQYRQYSNERSKIDNGLFVCGGNGRLLDTEQWIEGNKQRLPAASSAPYLCFIVAQEYLLIVSQPSDDATQSHAWQSPCQSKKRAHGPGSVTWRAEEARIRRDTRGSIVISEPAEQIFEISMSKFRKLGSASAKNAEVVSTAVLRLEGRTGYSSSQDFCISTNLVSPLHRDSAQVQ